MIRPHSRLIDTSALPKPLDREQYRKLRQGIYNDGAVSVFVNEDRDFAFLDPAPTGTDYENYLPRAESLGLTNYKKQRAVLEDRFSRLSDILSDSDSFLEIGAADGAFLQLVHEKIPSQRHHAVEPDSKTRAARDALTWLDDHTSIQNAIESGCKAGCVGMFHVFEHISDPHPMLHDIKHLLVPGGQLIVEVPCLLDPLLSLYNSKAYEEFYFQLQHPYVYSGASLARVLKAAGYGVSGTITHQRYGLENHLNWLQRGQPGGNAAYRELFTDIDRGYRRALEESGKSDTVFVVAEICE